MSSAVFELARQEFALHRRNRWVIIFAVLFAALGLAVAYFGMITSGYTGFQDFVRTSASLINLGGFPAAALCPPARRLQLSDPPGVSGDPRHPTGIESVEIILGKYLGLLISVLAAAALGFGLPGAIISASIGVEGAGTYLLVVLFSCLLAAVFTGLSVLIALLAGRRPVALGSRHRGMDLLRARLRSADVGNHPLPAAKGVAKNVLLVGLAGNPVDVVRVLCLLQVGGPSPLRPGRRHPDQPVRRPLLPPSGSPSSRRGLSSPSSPFKRQDL